jgi:hypothetical protein
MSSFATAGYITGAERQGKSKCGRQWWGVTLWNRSRAAYAPGSIEKGGRVPEASFSPSIRETLQRRAGGRCECQKRNCTHPREKRSERCTRSLGSDWEAQRITAGGGYGLSNLEALCKSCYVQTRIWRSVGVPKLFCEPTLFDFEKPTTKTTLETVSTLAHRARSS